MAAPDGGTGPGLTRRGGDGAAPRKSRWTEAGITADKHVAFDCGTGWRAAETWFYADLLGWPRAAVYDGGWFEWSQDPINNPTEIGLPDALTDDEDEAAA